MSLQSRGCPNTQGVVNIAGTHGQYARNLQLIGRETLYRRKNLTKLGLRQFIKPYLLRGLTIDGPNQVWCTDITYIPMKKGFMYLTALIDVYSRKIVGWGLSNSLTAEWCKLVLQDAIATHGKPVIVDSGPW